MKIENSVNSHLPSKITEENLLLHSIINHKKVICQCVDFASKDGQFYFSSQTFSIPMGYQGWFEILSEDGKTVAPCKSIQEVAESNPNTFLVRSKVKAYLSTDDGDPNYDRTRVIEKGEVLTMVGSMCMTYGWRKQKKKVLHCLDSENLDVYIDMKITGQFSPMAGPTNISGVHAIEGLIGQFRLPLTVRIVCGQVPRISTDNSQPGVFRLLEIQKDTTALFFPLETQQKLIPISTRTNLNFTCCQNTEEISHTAAFKHLKQLANTKAVKYSKTMQVLVSAKQSNNNAYSASTLPTRNKLQVGLTPLAKSDGTKKLTEEDILFAEVDDLYAYVRRGGVPPKPRPRSWATYACSKALSVSTSDLKSSSQPMLSNNGKPRGLLATLTAGKFPSKPTSTLVRRSHVETGTRTCSHQTGKFVLPERTVGLLTRREQIIQSYISRCKGSAESLQTDIDPYVDDRHYQNFEAIEMTKRLSGHVRQKSSDSNRSANYSRESHYSANSVDLPVKDKSGHANLTNRFQNTLIEPKDVLHPIEAQ